MLQRCNALHFSTERERDEASPYFTKYAHLKTVISPIGLNISEYDALENRQQCKDRLRRLGFGQGTPVVIFLGGTVKRNQCDKMICAMRHIRPSNTQLLILGPTELEEVDGLWDSTDIAEDRARQLDIAKRVAVVGLLSRRDYLRALTSADLACVLGNQDYSELAVAECLCAGTPVALTEDVPSAQDVVESGGGFVLNSNFKSEMLSAELTSWLLDPNLGMRASVAARAFAKKKYDINNIVEDWRRYYTEIIEGLTF